MVVLKNRCATGNYLHKRGHKSFYCFVATVEPQTAACCRPIVLSDQWLWNCVPFCCQFLQNGVGLSYQSLCQNISLQVQSECDQNFHGTQKLLMKTWINGPLGNWPPNSQVLIERRVATGSCSFFIYTAGEAALEDRVFKFHVQANTPCKCVFRAALLTLTLTLETADRSWPKPLLVVTALAQT